MLTNAELGARVRALRERAGIKSQDLAKALDIDPSAMSNIESGKRGIKTDELAAIARTLGVSPLAVLDETSLLARLPVSPRVDVASAAIGSTLERLQALAELHEVLAHEGLHAEPKLDDVPDVDVERWKESAERLASWATEHLEVPPRGEDRFSALADAIERDLGIDVVVEEVGDISLAGAAITDRSFPLVFVRGSQPRPRALFTLAHELAHVLASDGETFTLDVDLTARTDRERFANAFAATYLMPAEEVERHVNKGDTFLSFARMLDQFGVSYESLIYRLHNLGYINYQGRNNLQDKGIRGLLAHIDDENLAKSLLARLSGRRVETRPPALLTLRALMGYRKGIISARPLAGLLAQDAEDLLEKLETTPHEDANVLLKERAAGSDEEERYSGSPV